MSLIALPSATDRRPESRVARVGALLAPGALLLLSSAAAVSLAMSHSAIVTAIHQLVMQH